MLLFQSAFCRLVGHKSADPADALADVFHAGRIRDAYIVLAVRAEACTRHKTHMVVSQQLSGKVRCLHACTRDVDESVERTLRFYAGQARDLVDHMVDHVAALLEGRHHHVQIRLGLLTAQGLYASPLHRGVDAGAGVLVDLADSLDQIRRTGHIAQPPAGHGIGLGEGLDDDGAIRQR